MAGMNEERPPTAAEALDWAKERNRLWDQALAESEKGWEQALEAATVKMSRVFRIEPLRAEPYVHARHSLLDEDSPQA